MMPKTPTIKRFRSYTSAAAILSGDCTKMSAALHAFGVVTPEDGDRNTAAS